VFKTVILRTTFPSVKKGPAAFIGSVTKIQFEPFGFTHPEFICLRYSSTPEPLLCGTDAGCGAQSCEPSEPLLESNLV
jgi:hypothetical protein